MTNYLDESKRVLAEAQTLLAQFKDADTPMPAEDAQRFDKLMADSAALKAQHDRQQSILQMDEQLQAAADGTKQSAGATFMGFQGYKDETPDDLKAHATLLAQPDSTLGAPVNAREVRSVAERLYPAKSYDGATYDDLRWMHWQGFSKWARWGAVSLNAIERRLAFGGKVLLTPMQIATALRNGLGPSHLKDLVEGVDTAGGFAVPEDWRATVIRGKPDAVVVRPRARAVTTSRDVLNAPRLTGDGSSYSSAVRITWGAETPTAASHETDPTFGQTPITVHTAMASTQISANLLEDGAFDVAGLLSELYAEAYALGEDDAFLTGDGANKPLGLTATATNGITPVNSGNATSVTADGLIDLQYSLPPQYWANAVWIMNATSTGKAVRQLKDGEGDYLWQRGLMNGEPDMLLGKALAYSAFMPDLAASAKAAIYGDLNYYWIADRVGMTMQRLTEVYAERNMVGFVARKRVGGAPVVTNAFRVLNVSA